MRLIFIDETNPEPNFPNSREDRFLVVGALILDPQAARALTDQVEAIRDETGFDRHDSLKFSVADKPAHITRDQHKDAKALTIQACVGVGAKLIIYCALHKVIDRRGVNTYLNWSIDALLTKIEQHCDEVGEQEGYICMLDRHGRPEFPDYLKGKFRDRAHQQRVGFNADRLVSTAMVWDGTSHIASAADIIIGSFSYIINNPERDIAGRSLLAELQPLLWGHANGNNIGETFDRGFLLRPENVNHAPYRAHYTALMERLVNWSNGDPWPQ